MSIYWILSNKKTSAILSPRKIDTPENLKEYMQRVLDGFKRRACCYGILAEEWDGIKNTVFKEF